MIRLLGPGARLCDGYRRREVLRIGGLGLLGAGLGLPDLTRAAAAAPAGRPPAARSAGRGRASSSS